MPGRLKVLVLYDDWTAQTAAVYDQLLSFKDFSENEVCYALGTREGVGKEGVAEIARLATGFDVIVLHHSVRLYVTHYINEAWAEVLASCAAYKVLFLQDDYERTETTRCWMEKIGFDAFFTVVPEPYWEAVYPRARFPKLEMQQVLTGYVPKWALTRQPVKPLAQRSRFIGYRAFKLPCYFGDLGREKYRIGVKMREICEARGIAVDIEWDREKRIYGPAWFDFIEDCRATLGTESGSNVFDEDGGIERRISEALKKDPDLEYEEIHRRFMSGHEGRVKMNQVSPRIFESIALGSALVLFEGDYSGVVRAEEHFIPLKKDFSNVDEVLDKLRDTALLEAMTRRAYKDVIESGRYSYETFIARFDRFLRERVKPRAAGGDLFWLTPGGLDLPARPHRLTHGERHAWITNMPFSSSENCLRFLAAHGTRFSDKDVAEMDSKINSANEAVAREKERLMTDFDFFQSEITRLTKKSSGLADERAVACEQARRLASSAAVLAALAVSRRFALLRTLGLCAAPPVLKPAEWKEHARLLNEYLNGSRWLRRLRKSDARLGKALEAVMK